MGTSLNPTAPTASGATRCISEPSPGPRCRDGTQGCCWGGMLPGWDAAHPSDPGGEVLGITLGSELGEGRHLPLGLSSLGETPKIIFGLA